MRWTGLAMTPWVIPFLPYSLEEATQILVQLKSTILTSEQLEL